MASDSDDKEPKTADTDEADESALVPAGPDVGSAAGEELAEQAPRAAGELGAQRYVHAAFFFAAILLAYLSSKVLALSWNSLADWPAAVRAVPQLVSYPEEQRESLMLLLGAVIGIVWVIQMYRRPAVRVWSDEVAGELARVTWPNRETVVNGTLVVVITSTIATAYVAILDRFWGFLTTLVYGT